MGHLAVPASRAVRATEQDSDPKVPSPAGEVPSS